jgi:hypothetical protein
MGLSSTLTNRISYLEQFLTPAVSHKGGMGSKAGAWPGRRRKKNDPPVHPRRVVEL